MSEDNYITSTNIDTLLTEGKWTVWKDAKKIELVRPAQAHILCLDPVGFHKAREPGIEYESVFVPTEDLATAVRPGKIKDAILRYDSDNFEELYKQQLDNIAREGVDAIRRLWNKSKEGPIILVDSFPQMYAPREILRNVIKRDWKGFNVLDEGLRRQEYESANGVSSSTTKVVLRACADPRIRELTEYQKAQ